MSVASANSMRFALPLHNPFYLAITASLVLHAVLFYRFDKFSQPLHFRSPVGEIYVTAVESTPVTPSSRRTPPSAKPSKGKVVLRKLSAHAPPSQSPTTLGTNPLPEYPEEARQREWEGTTRLAIILDARGKGQRITLLSTSGYPVLDEAALKAAESWVFPKTAQVLVTVPVEFKLVLE